MIRFRVVRSAAEIVEIHKRGASVAHEDKVEPCVVCGDRCGRKSQRPPLPEALDRDRLLGIVQIVAGEAHANERTQEDENLSVAEADRRWKAYAQLKWLRHLCALALANNDRDALDLALLRWSKTKEIETAP